jgi:hypothetical protein
VMKSAKNWNSWNKSTLFKWESENRAMQLTNWNYSEHEKAVEGINGGGLRSENDFYYWLNRDENG